MPCRCRWCEQLWVRHLYKIAWIIIPVEGLLSKQQTSSIRALFLNRIYSFHFFFHNTARNKWVLLMISYQAKRRYESCSWVQLLHYVSNRLLRSLMFSFKNNRTYWFNTFLCHDFLYFFFLLISFPTLPPFVLGLKINRLGPGGWRS